MSDPTDWLTIYALRNGDAGEAMRALAARIRGGNLSPAFLEQLARHIDPDAKTPFGTKLVLKRPAAGRPRALCSLGLGLFMEAHVDFFGEKVEAAIAAGMAKFGVSRTTCKDALATTRARRKRDPAMAEMARETALLLRDVGYPDYQPL